MICVDNITLKLYDYLRGKCPFKGCSKNYNGICLSNDESHLEYVTKLVDHALNKDQGKIENINVMCSQVDIQEGHCDFCGNKMIEYTDYSYSGDSRVSYKFYECPKCK